MRHTTAIQVLALILILLIPACSQATNTPTPAGPQLLLEDDFVDPASGWLEAADAQASQGYRDGRLVFQIETVDLFVWDNPGVNFRDFVLEVDARQVSGDPASSYGVLARYVDEGNFYRFDLSGDGYFSVARLENEDWLVMQDWQMSEHIQLQGETNRIKIVCQGPQITFYANDQPLASVEDAAFERGDVGLFASTFTEPRTEVEFDNLIVCQVE